METELAKIEAYFEEIGRAWTKNPELVLSRQFFELWEETQKPSPFEAEGNVLKIKNHEIQLPGKKSIVVFCWDFDEETPCLVIESPNLETRYPVFITDGTPEVGEPTVHELQDETVGFGERLEFIMDIISAVREAHPSRNVMEMQKSEYNDAVQGIAGKYDQATVKLMSRLKLPEIRKLITKAVQDMALDELSDQLVLPLDGSYAAGQEEQIVVNADRTFAVHPSRPRTRYSILRDLRFLCSAGHALSELEQNLILAFNNCDIIEGENPMTVRIPVPGEVPLRKGESLMVFKRGSDAPVAKLRIELNDRTCVIAKLRWPDEPEPLTADFYAKPHRSPAKYMAQLMEAFAGEFEREGRFESAALNAGLGIDDFSFEDSALPEEDLGLDLSQQRAWANAVNPNNPIALVQGPPGTGKTHVLVCVLRDLARRGKRVLLAAPSHTAVDNVCRRILDLPLLRVGRDRDKVANDVASECWIGELSNVHKLQTKRESNDVAIYAGTHVGLLRDDIVLADLEKNGAFDAIIFDEAGMARMDEFLVCTKFALRAILFGDHQQLPPFPLPQSVLANLRKQQAVLRSQECTITHSPLQWLLEERNIPVFVLQSSYRCQNPRLMRFSSTLFYNAQVKASAYADYYQLPFDERQKKYPSSTLRFFRTSALPLNTRCEHLVLEGGQPGFENELEAQLAVHLLLEQLKRYPLDEITVIAPYRRQVMLIRELLTVERLSEAVGGDLSEEELEQFRHSRISTVDSFQGGESDLVIICYVRSSAAGGVGFVDDPNRINVAHTRCRREMIIIGDLECLKRQSRDRIFHRMERAVDRDGMIIDVSPDFAAELQANYKRLPKEEPEAE